MNMSFIDWVIVTFVMGFVLYFAFKTQKYLKSVADFCSANRCAGRYLLGVARGEVGLAAVSVVAGFEIFYSTGFSPLFWGFASIPLSLFLSLSGFVYYRFRETRALTLAQFFEMRYSRNFRVFAAIICWISGLLNFGIFPGIAARFFMTFCGFPEEITLYGVSVGVFPVLMLVLVFVPLILTLAGGQVTILVTDFWQGIFAFIIFAVIAAFLWFSFPWSQICETMKIVSMPGKSFVNPIDIGDQKDFNLIYFVIAWFMSVYSAGAWQGTQGYNSSAINAHEAKMAGVIKSLRGGLITLGLMLIPLAALTYMNHPDFSFQAAGIKEALEQTYPQNENLQRQMLVPFVLNHILPIGLTGAFVAAMIGFSISTDDTYMHSWGTIFAQDIVCPLLKKPLSSKNHLLLLRLSIVFVAVFSYVFSLVFPVKEYIQLFLTITGAVYLGGAGSVLLGGLYWKRGTTQAAYAALITGSILAVSSIILRLVWEHVPLLVGWKSEMPVNSQVATFSCAIISISIYVLVSLLGKRQVIEMDKILHREKYTLKEESRELKREYPEKQVGKFWKFIGVNNKEFSNVDKSWFLFAFLHGMYGMAAFFILLLLALFGFMNNDRWLVWWRIYIMINLSVGAIAGSIAVVGGCFDLSKMYKMLRGERVNDLDDGGVREKYIELKNTDTK